jgi:hypothetical protein
MSLSDETDSTGMQLTPAQLSGKIKYSIGSKEQIAEQNPTSETVEPTRNLTVPQNPGDVNGKMSLSDETDSEYFAAVERGDMDSADYTEKKRPNTPANQSATANAYTPQTKVDTASPSPTISQSPGDVKGKMSLSEETDSNGMGW